jgi:regulator of sigma E protease
MVLTVVSFVLVMSVLVFAHELGHFLVAKRNHIVVEEFGFGYPPRLVKLAERNGTIYSINAIPFGGFVRMRGEDDPTLTGSFAAASKLARTSTLLAGATMNFLLAIVLFTALTLITGVPDSSRPGALIGGIAPGSPAEQAGLRVGDRIVAADGTQLVPGSGLKTYTDAHLGKPIVYRVERPLPGSGATESLEITIVPRVSPPKDQGALGVQIGVAYRPAKIWEALGAGVRTTGEIIWMTFQIPATLIREGRPISEAGFMGPIGIAATTGDVVRSALAIDSFLPIISFVALLSAALGITNLLPIPALDGGRLLFVLLEAIRGKRVEPAQEGLVHMVGFGLLLLLVGVITVREIGALLNGTFPTMGLH